MAYEFDSIIRSSVFTFCIGEEKKPIPIHSKAIANLSDALEGMISGKMREAQEQRVEFPEVTTDTFARLCEFAYVGDYEVPKPVIKERRSRSSSTSPAGSEDGKINGNGDNHDRPEVAHDWEDAPAVFSDEPAEPEPEPAISFWGSSSRKTRKQMKKSKTAVYFEDSDGEVKAHADDSGMLTRKADLRKSFDEIPLFTGRSLKRFEPAENKDPTEDFTQVFLSHAGLYVFAKQYLIDDLKDLVIAKLHKTLSAFRLFDNRVSDVVRLVRYVFDEDHTDEVDELREMIVHYIACDVQTFTNCAEFMELVEEGGPFVRDLWKLVASRLLK